jgi:chromosomal replication initiation ATPase DnaA
LIQALERETPGVFPKKWISIVTVEDVVESTAKKYGVSPLEFAGFRSGAGGRDVAAYLCRRFTSATLAELSGVEGQSMSSRD